MYASRPKMKVVATDVIDVAPADVDDFRIGVAETYDVIVTPTKDAHTIFAQNIDRSAMLRQRLLPKKVLVLPYLLWTKSNG